MSRIPFRVRDELMIASMARWMRFIGVIKVVSGLVTAFLLLVAIIYIGAELGVASTTGSGPAAETGSTVTVSIPGANISRIVKMRQLISENPVTFSALGAFGLLLAAAGTVLGFILYQAADDFDRVARTDVADQDYITAGITQLNTYLKVSILLGVAAVLVAITAAIGLLAKSSV